MKTNLLFEFAVADLAATLHAAFGEQATAAFDNKEEAQCGRCLHQCPTLFVIADTQREALRGVNGHQLGLCGECVARLIAERGWKIVVDGSKTEGG